MNDTTIAVHRCRFVDFAPSPISALAFPPLPLPSAKNKKKATTTSYPTFGTLAVGHANGNIDLCQWTHSEHPYQSPHAWTVRKTLPGPVPSKVDSLAFAIRHPEDLAQDDVPSIRDLRLFSSGGGTDLAEWNLDQGCLHQTIPSKGGSIWSIAVNPSSTLLALGCEDGSVRLVSLQHDTLTHHRQFDRVKCRLLSIAWGPPVPRTNSAHAIGDKEESSDDDDDISIDWSDSWIVAGCSDSNLRTWDVASGRLKGRMSTDKARGERTLVWAVGVLGDGTIISGDSLGMVKFWDPLTCTQLQSFQGHNADVLCLAIGGDGMAVYTSGVDQRISQYCLVTSHGGMPPNPSVATAQLSTRWVHSCARRMHSHDVRALATWPPYIALPPSHSRSFSLEVSPILVSGGMDMAIVLTPAALPTSTVTKVTNPLCTSADSTFEMSYHRRLAYTSGPSSTLAVRLASHARLLACMRDTGLTIWKILQKSQLGLSTQDPVDANEKGWEKVLDMELNVHTNLIAFAISNDGHWFVASDLYETKLFYLAVKGNINIEPRRIRGLTSMVQTCLPSSVSTGGSAFCFTPDSSKLVMATAMSAHLLIIDLDDTSQDTSILRAFDSHRLPNGFGHQLMKIQNASGSGNATPFVRVLRLAVSADGQWLASSDDHARTHVFNLDSVQHHCALPSFPHPAHFLTFNPSHPNLLVIGLADGTLQIFDVETRQFPPWSDSLSPPPPHRLQTRDPILGLAFDPTPLDTAASTDRSIQALLWSSSWLRGVTLDGCTNTSTKKRRRHGRKHNKSDLNEDPSTSNDTEDTAPHGHPRGFNVITQYRPNLFVGYVGTKELVIVERPLVDVLATLPSAYFKHKYGES